MKCAQEGGLHKARCDPFPSGRAKAGHPPVEPGLQSTSGNQPEERRRNERGGSSRTGPVRLAVGGSVGRGLTGSEGAKVEGSCGEDFRREASKPRECQGHSPPALG